MVHQNGRGNIGGSCGQNYSMPSISARRCYAIKNILKCRGVRSSIGGTIRNYTVVSSLDWLCGVNTILRISYNGEGGHNLFREPIGAICIEMGRAVGCVDYQ